MVECLRAEGVSVLFGYPGATIAPFYDSLYDSGLRHILTRTEQGAGHAASGYARITGRPGVCVATSGPGATNLFTAIATAYADSIPLVAVTGQVATCQLGRDVFQEVDTTGAAEPFTKYAYLVKSASELPRVFKEAFHIASTGRKGPVLIDVPVDVQSEMLAFSYPDSVNIRGYKPRYDGHALQIRRVAEALSSAKRPLLCLGGGIFSSVSAAERLRRLSERCDLPVVTTLMGVSAMPVGHPLYFGMIGQFGAGTANAAMRESDLIVLLGARAGDRAIARPEVLEISATIVHIDIDTAEIGKNLGATIPLVGDAGRVVEQLLAKDIRGEWDDWRERLAQLRAGEQRDHRDRAAKPGFVEPHAFVRRLCGKLPRDAVYVADVGQNQLWSAVNYSAAGRFMTTGGMGTMGYSIPAAIGAKTAAPNRTVVAVCGDGSLQMSMNEFATMRQHGIPVKVVVMTNGKLGLVRQIQTDSFGDREIGVDLAGSPDFGKIAEAYAFPHRRICSDADADAAIDAMLADDGPYLLECLVDPREETR